MIEFVFGHLAAKGVAVNAEYFGGAGLVAVVAVEDALDEALFKLADSFIEENAPVDHLQNQAF